MDAGVINFAVYENGSEYLGIAEVTLPSYSNKKFTVNGAGIPGDVDIPVIGHRDAATIQINFINASPSAHKLAEERKHLIDLRVAQQEYNTTKGKIDVGKHKHVLEIIPLERAGGSLKPASPQGASGTYSVLSHKEYINGKLVSNYDPLNFKNVDDTGKDSLAEVRSALGK